MVKCLVVMSKTQQRVLEDILRGEEREFFREKLKELGEIWSNMPNLRGQEGAGDEAIAYLHYFKGDFHIYVTERDPESLEVFGLMGRIGCRDRKKGYQSLENITEMDFELDLHFTPRTLNAVMEAEKPAQEKISVDALLDDMPLEMAWPPGMDVEAASEAFLQRNAEFFGKEIVGDIRAAFFEKIEQALEEDREVTPEQQEFFDEESESRSRNPLYQKPKPT